MRVVSSPTHFPNVYRSLTMGFPKSMSPKQDKNEADVFERKRDGSVGFAQMLEMHYQTE
jgi:hypothetical protein